ncbi:MAG: hypothetical protein ACD_73C00362G0002 [uncultured bacterium]|nr:MAG: hypothetical protein ACD_73C00362G0002 [uncultured bacterium]
MPVCSYIIYPIPGQEVALENRLKKLQYSEVHADEKRTLFVLVTDTPTSQDEKTLQKTLEGIQEIQCTALSFIGNPDA